MANFYTVLGFTEDVNTCYCCGRSDLKGTVKMEGPDGLAYFGTGCAAKMCKVTEKTIKEEITKKEKEARLLASDEYRKTEAYAANEAELSRLNSGSFTPMERMAALAKFKPALEAEKSRIKTKYGLPKYYTL